MATSLSSKVLTADRETLLGLKALRDYQPSNQDYRVEALVSLEQQLLAAYEERVRMLNAYEAALVNEQHIAQQFHAQIVGARYSVKAQYGADAPEIQAVGLTRRSDRKRPQRSAAQ